MSCLIIKNDGIGDLILSSGVIADIATAWGLVDLITCEANREIAENLYGVRRIFYVSRDAIQFQCHTLKLGLHWLRHAKQDKAVFQELASTEYDQAICLRRYIRQSSLILMSKVRAKSKHCAWLFPTNSSTAMAEEYSNGWKHYRGPMTDRSELTYYREFLQKALHISSRSSPSLKCVEHVRVAPEKGRMGLVISGASTNWPKEYWLELAGKLTQAGKRIVLFGGQEAISVGREIEMFCSIEANHVGKLSFGNAVSELAQLELLIGNDTGFTHFATLATDKVLIILGGGTFGRFFPWPETKNQFVIYHGMDCFDCDWQCQFSRVECLYRVQPAAVLNYAEKILQGHAHQQHNHNSLPVTYRLAWRRIRESKETAVIAATN